CTPWAIKLLVGKSRISCLDGKYNLPIQLLPQNHLMDRTIPKNLILKIELQKKSPPFAEF
ncbi:MAG: hypothetical protein RBQ66_05600, partial [Candidatus Cloacimonadaceae bacterium]|nr:hypothetical protein [Candidatus Cloacimonadaceae bacterium]